jgi:hypothetical protein
MAPETMGSDQKLIRAAIMSRQRRRSRDVLR